MVCLENWQNYEMREILPPRYEPNKVEQKIYELWEKSGYFNPDNLPVVKTKNYKLKTKNFCIIMPPPNANGMLHLGHALGATLQDIMIRFERMRGKKTLWLPGADHAGFETQVVFDKKLEKEGRNRFEIPRKELYQEMLKFTLENKKVMEGQLRRLGASCDWSREKFTLDEDIIKVVYRTFEKLKEDGLLYKGKRIVNWCVKHQTSLSDVEVKYEERISPLYYVKYEVPELKTFITVATTRPETIPADVAIAVHPKDNRYKNLNGKYAINPLNGEKLLIIADSGVDKDFGTGALKITPEHDRLDEEIYSRHPEINKKPRRVINFYGKMEGESVPAELVGLKVGEARLKATEILRQKEKLLKIDENYKNNVALCYKCSNQIEPLALDNQWFIKMTEKPASGGLSLRDSAVQAVKEKKIKFIPARFEKVFLHWMRNLRDWNISRQIVWGIKIPDLETNDVFDTWFSSGQWPFATLLATRDKEQETRDKKLPWITKDFETFYPTAVMETAYDILFFWVARMIMLGIYTTGKPPFKTVYLHGLVRDRDRQKMSKSRGNVIDPLGVIDLYGTDALRMALIVGNTPGNDPIVYEEKVRGYRNFANKIWNAARFILMNTQDYKEIAKPKLTAHDKKILRNLKKLSADITKFMDSFKFYRAAEHLYHYFWHTFADKIIEQSKPRLNSNDKKDRLAAQYVLLEILKTNLKLLHPFMPFITEEIWQELPQKKKSLLIVEEW